MMVLFIRKFLEYRNQIHLRLKALRNARQENTQEYAQLLLIFTRINEMRDYIAHGDWCRKATRDKYVFWITSGYNYMLTAAKYKTSEQCVRVLVSRADATLAKILGRPLQQIIDGNLVDGWIEFCININKLDIHELYGRPVLTVVPKPTDLELCYSLEDCKNEIKFLRSFSSYEIRKQMENLDSQKMLYLLALCSLNDPAYLEERKKLIKAILRINNNQNSTNSKS